MDNILPTDTAGGPGKMSVKDTTGKAIWMTK